MTVSISPAWSRSAATSIPPLAGAQVRANASHSARIGSRWAMRNSASRIALRRRCLDPGLDPEPFRYRTFAATGRRVSSNLTRLDAWLAGRPLAPTRVSRFARLAP